MTEEAQPQPIPATQQIEVPVELKQTTQDPKAEEARRSRIALMTWLEKLSGEIHTLGDAVLLSRQVSRADERFFWEHTGFVADKGTIYAKCGNAQFQPIGHDDGFGFYPTEGSKIMWAREFAIARLQPFQGAFLNQKKADEAIVDDTANAAYLSDPERANMEQALTGLSEEIQRYAASKTEEEEKENEERLVDTVKLSCLQCPKLDHRLQKMAQDNPELNSSKDKQDLAKVDAKSLAGSCIEFLRMKLDDDKARRYFISNELVPAEDPEKATLGLIDSMIARISALIAKDESEQNISAIIVNLEGAGVVYPPVRAILQPFVGTSDITGAARAAIAFLEEEKVRLTKA